MFRKAKLPWEMMLQVGVDIVLRHHGIQEGVLVTDEEDHGRSKKTKRIFKAHKIKDKSSGGYINGQTIVLLMLITPKVSLPVGFEFYQADPEQLARVENKLPAYTVGSLQRTIQMEALLTSVQQLVQAPNPDEQLMRLGLSVKEFFRLRPSGKHMSGRDLGRLEPTPTLKYRAVA